MTRSTVPDYSLTIPLATEIPEDGDDDASMPASALTVDAAEAAALAGTVPPEAAGERFDKVLARLFPAYSRSRLQGWIDAGRVSLDGAPARLRQRVSGGEQVVVRPAALPEQMAFTPEPVALDVVYEDAQLVVLNKPAGLVVHPAAGNWSGTLLNGLLHRYGEAAAGLPRAGIVHRLDKDTSGLMVVARTLTAQTDLVRQLQARTVKRYYAALVWGTPPTRALVDAPLGRDPRERTRMAVVAGAAGKPARTRLATLAGGQWQGQPVSLVLCSLDTGRTHQIRVHLTHLGHPLLGDSVYRGRYPRPALPGAFGRQALHAWRLGLLHPADGQPMSWQSGLPEDMRDLLGALGLSFDMNELSASEHIDDLFASS
ncbi:MAG: RluA family pseudouridine synthase [Pandoraea sp.]|nr:MAG: RluA family pseudouridine synthase [Pandoraea sp.]TAM18531.1 MAG: RluA family pseudouridine synthase [Pandoraea sp.]